MKHLPQKFHVSDYEYILSTSACSRWIGQSNGQDGVDLTIHTERETFKRVIHNYFCTPEASKFQELNSPGEGPGMG